jgi:hypothetical protein
VPWQSYYYVWSPAGFKPTRRHETEDGAREQAVQLRKRFPEQTFLIFKAECVDGAPAPEVTA